MELTQIYRGETVQSSPQACNPISLPPRGMCALYAIQKASALAQQT